MHKYLKQTRFEYIREKKKYSKYFVNDDKSSFTHCTDCAGSSTG